MIRIFLICLTGLTLPCSCIVADDWPQILGPSRNGEANGENLLEKWPADGPKLNWKRECGQGFAGVAVKDDRAYLFHRLGNKDVVECLNAVDGKEIWKTEFQALYRGGFSEDLGPRCVPLVHGKSIFCFGAAGTLRKLSLESGEEVWSVNLFEKYQANEGYFGAGSSPIIVDDTLIVIVGGRKAGIVALNLDGQTKWTTEPDTASYSAPVAVKLDDKSCVACVSKYFLKIVDVANGKSIAEQEFGKRGPTVNAAAPLVIDDKLFITAAYNIGGRMLQLKSMDKVWENDTSMSSQYTTSIRHQGFLYGCHGREDFGNGELRCVRIADGKVLWSNSETGICHLIKSGDKALVWSIDGNLKLIRLNEEKFELLDSTQIVRRNSKSLPALSNGRLFLKSNGGRRPGELLCYQVGTPKG